MEETLFSSGFGFGKQKRLKIFTSGTRGALKVFFNTVKNLIGIANFSQGASWQMSATTVVRWYLAEAEVTFIKGRRCCTFCFHLFLPPPVPFFNVACSPVILYERIRIERFL